MKKPDRAAAMVVLALVAGTGCGSSNSVAPKPRSDASAGIDGAAGSGGGAGAGAPGSGGGGGAIAIGTGGSVGTDAATPDAGGGDATETGGPRPLCAGPGDCAALGRPGASGNFCTSPSWSCIAGRCLGECRGGRTCALDGAGCLSCPGEAGAPDCPGAVCDVVPQRMTRVESMTCATPPDLTGWTCNGSWAQLANGTLCSIQATGSNALRWSIACEQCLTIVVQM